MITGKHKRLDPSKLQPLIDDVLDNNGLQYHRSGAHQLWMTGNMENGTFWKKYPELYEYLKKNIYPYDLPIADTWFKFYNANNELMGLHQDRQMRSPPHDDIIIITTTILLMRSPDAQGGYLILAGDSFETGPPEKRFKDTRDIAGRLKIINLKKVGETAVWNGHTVHGVSEMTKGQRLALVVIKKMKYDEEYFKNG